MGEILEVFGSKVFMQSITFFQLFLIVELFLERKKIKRVSSIGYFTLVIIGLFTVLLLDFRVNLYMMVINVLTVGLFYEGKRLYKVLAVVIGFVFNLIVGATYTSIVNSIFRNLEILSEVDKLFVQAGCAIVTILIVIVFRATGLIKKKDKNYLLPQKETFILTVVALLSTEVAYLGAHIYEGNLQVQHNTVFLGVTIISTLVINIGIILIMDRDVHTRYYKQLSEEAEKELMKQLAYYEQLEVGQKEVRALKHDMRHHLGCIRTLIEKRDEVEALSYIADLDHLVQAHDTIQTGSPIMNALLNDYVQKAKENETVLEIEVGNLKELPIERVDVCAIFANALENALEASEKQIDTQKRKIKLVAKVKQGYFLFKITNPVVEDRSGQKDFLQTTKQDKKCHGYGIHNIEKAVKKYNGELHIKVENGQFVVEGMINNQPLRKTS
jgi:hypothetical protein